MHSRTRFAATLLALAALGCSGDQSGTVAPARLSADRVRSGAHTEVHLKRLGRPRWRPVDFHMFSEVIGTFDDGFVEFNANAAAIQPPPNHVQRPDLGTGPGAPHPPPYDKELAMGLVPLGFHDRQEFSVAGFSGSNGVYFIWMTVPNPANSATGSSPDFASGPIIPNSIFPISIAHTTTRNGVLYEPAYYFSVPALDGNLDPPFDVDGHSHFSVIIADGAVFVSPDLPVRGHYQYQDVVTDKDGNGWVITVRFEVED